MRAAFATYFTVFIKLGLWVIKLENQSIRKPRRHLLLVSFFQSSFADIANVLSEFFRDLDVVPSDVIVGLVLLRKRQQLLRFRTVHQVS